MGPRALGSVVAAALGAFSLDAIWALHIVCGLKSCGSWAPERSLRSRGMWELPGQGIKPVSCALQGRFLTTGQLGKP